MDGFFYMVRREDTYDFELSVGHGWEAERPVGVGRNEADDFFETVAQLEAGQVALVAVDHLLCSTDRTVWNKKAFQSKASRSLTNRRIGYIFVGFNISFQTSFWYK